MIIKAQREHYWPRDAIQTAKQDLDGQFGFQIDLLNYKTTRFIVKLKYTTFKGSLKHILILTKSYNNEIKISKNVTRNNKYMFVNKKEYLSHMLNQLACKSN